MERRLKIIGKFEFFYGNITAELLIFKSNSNNRKM